MPRYFFDVRDGDFVTYDTEGHEFLSVEKAYAEAAQTASELANDRFPSRLGHGDQQMAVNVRDEDGPLVGIRITFQAELLR